MSIFSAFSNISSDQRTTVAHWSVHAPSSNVAWARIPEATQYVGWVSCSFSSSWLVLSRLSLSLPSGARGVMGRRKAKESLPRFPFLQELRVARNGLRGEKICLAPYLPPPFHFSVFCPHNLKPRILASFLPSSETFFDQMVFVSPTFPNSNSMNSEMVEKEPFCAFTTTKSLFIYLCIYLWYIYYLHTIMWWCSYHFHLYEDESI